MTLDFPTYNSVSSALEQPILRPMRNKLHLLMFRLMKLVPAKYILTRALERGELGPGGLVLETSSGTFALGLGIVCCERGLPFVIFSDPVIDRDLRNHLEFLGGEVCILDSPAKVGGYQQARLDALHARLQTSPRAFWTRQYSNPDNRRAYHAVADQLVAGLGERLTLVGSVGSGGSTCGLIERLREHDPAAKLIGVDTFGSVLFGQPDGARMMRGLGNSLLPSNLDHSHFDEIHWVGAEAGFNAARSLLRKEALYAGPTTGAAWLVASWYSALHPEETVVFLGADEGYRYASTVFDSGWLAANGLRPDAPLPEGPNDAAHPAYARGAWARFSWRRRTLAEVTQSTRGAA